MTTKWSGSEESAAADKMMLTYPCLVASVVFSKGHEANGDALEERPDGWCELEGGRETKRDVRILIHFSTVRFKSET